MPYPLTTCSASTQLIYPLSCACSPLFSCAAHLCSFVCVGGHLCDCCLCIIIPLAAVSVCPCVSCRLCRFIRSFSLSQTPCVIWVQPVLEVSGTAAGDWWPHCPDLTRQAHKYTKLKQPLKPATTSSSLSEVVLPLPSTQSHSPTLHNVPLIVKHLQNIEEERARDRAASCTGSERDPTGRAKIQSPKGWSLVRSELFPKYHRLIISRRETINTLGEYQPHKPAHCTGSRSRFCNPCSSVCQHKGFDLRHVPQAQHAGHGSAGTAAVRCAQSSMPRHQPCTNTPMHMGLSATAEACFTAADAANDQQSSLLKIPSQT